LIATSQLVDVSVQPGGGSRSDPDGGTRSASSIGTKPSSAITVKFAHLLRLSVDSGRWRSGFRNDVDQDYEVMPITIPTRCRSQIATASEW
jgi:hypothetical protein